MTPPRQIIFLHGWTMRGAAFDDVIARLEPDFECYAPDLPGHGTSTDPDITLNGCAKTVHGLVQTLDHPILVGWSMGAATAWRYIAQHGTDALGGLVTIDMSPRILPAPGWNHGLNAQNAEAVRATSSRMLRNWPDVAKSIVRNMYAPGSEPALSRAAVLELLIAQDPARLAPLWDDLVAMDERQTITNINLPYLVCYGAQSRLYGPDVTEWIVASAPSARVKAFLNAGHSPHLEEPDKFVDALRAFAPALAAPTPTEEQ